ncbi:unnamed protein product, partial [Durusdinium trenchii]
MPKRKTSMPEPKAKAKAKASPSLPAIPPDSAKLPHMKLLNEWDEVLREHGALDLYLNKMLDTKDSRQVVVTENCANCARSQEKCIEFYNFIEEKYPPVFESRLLHQAECRAGKYNLNPPRRPNCFNLLHQMEILMRDGCTTESAVEGLEALDSASSVAAAYSVGRTEEQLQRTCSIFLACLAMFGASVPTGYMAEVKDEIMSTFVNRHADADLMNLVQTSAPPCDLSKIDLFKNHLGKFQKKAGVYCQHVSMRLEAALLQTTWSQTELTIQSDINALRGWADKFKLFANQQGWLDLQYLASRYENGKKAVADYMARRHTFGAFKNLMLSQGEIVSKQAALGKSAFSEWSIACCKKQLSVLVDGNPGPSFHYMGLFLEDDAKVMTKNSSTIAGMLMTQWWDESGEAGPKRLHCKAALQNSQMHVGKDRNDESFWINETGENESISARELFGFNVGSFNELTTGFDGVIESNQP